MKDETQNDETSKRRHFVGLFCKSGFGCSIAVICYMKNRSPNISLPVTKWTEQLGGEKFLYLSLILNDYTCAKRGKEKLITYSQTEKSRSNVHSSLRLSEKQFHIVMLFRVITVYSNIEIGTLTNDSFVFIAARHRTASFMMVFVLVSTVMLAVAVQAHIAIKVIQHGPMVDAIMRQPKSDKIRPHRDSKRI